jgi:hypothetical protein
VVEVVAAVGEAELSDGAKEAADEARDHAVTSRA